MTDGNSKGAESSLAFETIPVFETLCHQNRPRRPHLAVLPWNHSPDATL